MQLSILAAGFTPGEADRLRRGMAAWRRTGSLDEFEGRIINGMQERGYTEQFARSTFEQMKGFSSYGFPESHAASFALIVWASCWIKCHYPAEFLCALLNSQPMGFYPPSQLVQDARRHDVEVRPVDVLHSHWDCTLEDIDHTPAVRLGLCMVTGFKEASALRIVAAREAGYFDDAQELARRADLEHLDMRQLAAADALQSLSGHRRNQVWEAAALRRPPELLKEAAIDEDDIDLPEAAEVEAVLWDYRTTGLTLRSHPLALIRDQLQDYFTWNQLKDTVRDGAMVQFCGQVTLRQSPPTAKGVLFISLEDETGIGQIIVRPGVRDSYREVLLGSNFLGVKGRWQQRGNGSLIADEVHDLSAMLGELPTPSRDFR